MCQEQRILDLLVESSISGERSCRMIGWQSVSWWKQMEGKDTSAAGRFDIYEHVKCILVRLYGGGCV